MNEVEDTEERWHFHCHVQIKSAGLFDASHDLYEIASPENIVASLQVDSHIFLFATFLRVQDMSGSYCHKVWWGISDVQNKRYLSDTAKDSPFMPDEDQRKKFSWHNVPLCLNFNGNLLHKDDAGCYHLNIPKSERGCGFALKFSPNKGTFSVHGQLTVPVQHEWHNCLFDNSPVHVPSTKMEVSGIGWGDFQSGAHAVKMINVQFCFMLNSLTFNGTCVFDLERNLISLAMQGLKGKISMKITSTWISSQSFLEYQTGWTLCSEDCTLDIQASFPEQEHASHGMWEGQVGVSGELSGHPVTGIGVVRQNCPLISDMSLLLKQVTRITKIGVENILPREPSRDMMLKAVASAARPGIFETISSERFRDTIAVPIRDIVDRGGKCWRGLAFLLSIDVVGGNSNKFAGMLGSIEIQHVGSMIVDDVQDRSNIRRGGPACHKVIGEALAINAGTFAYFLGMQSPLNCLPWLHPKKKLLYLEENCLVLRAGHFGQALDLSGLNKEMESAVMSGCNTKLIDDVLAIHKLKTAVAAGAVARIGAIFGGGSMKQQEMLCEYYEKIGLAFQIIDDVLNLTGFSEGQKECGEDLTEGKITFPVALAVGLLSLEDRKKLWAIVESRPTEKEAIRECISLIRNCGALELSKVHAESLVSNAWNNVSSVVSDSVYKTMLCGFGRFVLDRWY